ncbi:cupin domain-containing protein [Vulcanococcus limneticus]|uniref:cupin domain-containing protein n=1 Tax=Vulcanococcus limneticus TaxID=2170428 RepID=UPI00398BF936
MGRIGACLLGLALAGPGLARPASAHPPLAQADPGAAAAPAVQVMGTPGPDSIVTVRPRSSITSRQGLKQFVGISGANSGARGLSMNRVVIPPGGRAAPHSHVGSESAIYLLTGTVKTFYGTCLEKTVTNRAGDFLFIPAGVPHMPVNLSSREPAIALVARNDANEQENVIPHAAPGTAGAATACPR